MFMMKIMILDAESFTLSVKATYMGNDPQSWQFLNFSFYICVVSIVLYISDRPFVIFLVLSELQLLRKIMLLMWPNNNNTKVQM